jgi:hypothetical protein
MRTRSTVTSARGKRESRLEILSVMAVELKKSSCKMNTDIPIIQTIQAVFRIRIQSGQWNSEFGSRRAKMTRKNREKLRNFMFCVTNVLFWRMKASPVAWTSFMEAYG